MIDHCFTISVWFVIHPHEWTIDVRVSPALESPSHIPCIPTSLGYYSARVWVPWVLTANSRWLSIYKCWCTCLHAALSIHVTLSLLFPTLVRKSVHYVCVSSADMWTDSSDPSFSIPCFSLSDWLACLICSRFIPFLRMDSNVFHPGSDCSLAVFEEDHGAIVLHFSLGFQP